MKEKFRARVESLKAKLKRFSLKPILKYLPSVPSLPPLPLSL